MNHLLRRQPFATLTLAVLLAAGSPSFTHASGHAAPAHGGSGHPEPAKKSSPGESETKEGDEHGADPLRTDVLDLGEFEIFATLSAHHTNIEIRFALHLILSSTTTTADFERMQNWQRRFRDQAIIAVRSADPADFADPKLERLRRLILLRMKRLPAPAKIIGVYLTDFAVDKEE